MVQPEQSAPNTLRCIDCPNRGRISRVLARAGIAAVDPECSGPYKVQTQIFDSLTKTKGRILEVAFFPTHDSEYNQCSKEDLELAGDQSVLLDDINEAGDRVVRVVQGTEYVLENTRAAIKALGPIALDGHLWRTIKNRPNKWAYNDNSIDWDSYAKKVLTSSGIRNREKEEF